MNILVTGAAGFIGFHVAAALLARGDRVIGIDNLNDYYDVALKQARLAQLNACDGFSFARIDIADTTAMADFAAAHPAFDGIVHLAAQAGVRHSLENPRSYVRSNLVGQIEILELARFCRGLRHLVYASSSSVYGNRAKLPFSVADPCDAPRSIYAATKRADELMTHSYSHLFDIPATGLRFFTVYGPWGRPDMAPMLFASAILERRPIRLFNHGDMARDFTYIDDIVTGVVAALDRPPTGADPHRIYNIGNHKAEALRHFLSVLERACGVEGEFVLEAMQPGDVEATYADIADTTRDLGFLPHTTIEEGLPRFVAWYRDFYRV